MHKTLGLVALSRFNTNCYCCWCRCCRQTQKLRWGRIATNNSAVDGVAAENMAGMVGTSSHLPSVTAVSVDILFLVVMVCFLVEVSKT